MNPWNSKQYPCVTINHCNQEGDLIDYKEFRADFDGWNLMIADCISALQSYISSNGSDGDSILVEVEMYGEDGHPCEDEEKTFYLKIDNGVSYDISLIEQAVSRKHQVNNLS